ncbi:MAG: hypothetical protein MJH10_10870 [Epibacterium sp.]|nr:hypothetical protein [Epibacterium sp.]NQX74046.1 hypothetical protein [Epibacterium sp.]
MADRDELLRAATSLVKAADGLGKDSDEKVCGEVSGVIFRLQKVRNRLAQTASDEMLTEHIKNEAIRRLFLEATRPFVKHFGEASGHAELGDKAAMLDELRKTRDAIDAVLENQ